MATTISRNIRPPGPASATQFTPIETLPEPSRSRRREFFDKAQALLAERFRGVTLGGAAEAGLFPLAGTGVSLAPVLEAALALKSALTKDQWAEARFPIDDRAWREWHNMHTFMLRHGLALHDKDAALRSAVMRLVEASSSAAGYASARNVMRLNGHAGEVTNRPQDFDEWFYWISIFGDPDPSEPWGWQIDGHHLCVSCFIYGDRMVMTPDFRGSEPVFAETGKFAGTRVFEEEESGGLALMNILTPDQRRQAVIGMDLPRDVITTAQVDNYNFDRTGVCCEAMTRGQQEALMAVIETYVGRIRPGHADLRMREVQSRLSDTWFGWIGETGADSPFYYRILSPVILIEFDHLPGIIWDNTEPTRDHIHTIVRTPNGNDYGRDLLRQHYETHDHSHPHTHHRRGKVLRVF
jgi:hypothetical protein